MRIMKSRMKRRDDGKYFVWNYWEPAGPWDYKPDGSTKHWVGVHPNGGYYSIDVDGDRGCVRAWPGLHEGGHRPPHRHEPRLHVEPPDQERKFQRIDGEKPDPRWENAPGELWPALAPYDPTLREIFEANHDPGGWGGLSSTPEWVARYGRTAEAGR